MLKVTAEDFIKPECVEIVLPLYRELVSATKKEPRCIAYDLYIDEKDPGHFIFIEEWPDHAALDAHCASEHFRRLVPLIDQHKRKDARYILMNCRRNSQADGNAAPSCCSGGPRRVDLKSELSSPVMDGPRRLWAKRHSRPPTQRRFRYSAPVGALRLISIIWT